MSKIKICLKKPCLKRAFRTFIQTALGYVITNVTLALGGLDFNDGDVVKNALIGLAVAAVIGLGVFFICFFMPGF